MERETHTHIHILSLSLYTHTEEHRRRTSHSRIVDIQKYRNKAKKKNLVNTENFKIPLVNTNIFIYRVKRFLRDFFFFW